MKKVLVIFLLIPLMMINVKASELMGIMIDGVSLEGFDANKTTYDLKYEASREKIMIGLIYDGQKYDVVTSGANNYSLKSGLNVYTITVTSKEDKNDTKTYTLNITREDTRSNDNTLASLTVAEKTVLLEKDKNDYEVMVDNTLKSVSITATLANEKASFIQGYGERIGNNQVTLSNSEKTEVEIKVKAENEEIRTYKITIIKSNYKNNDATLKDIKIKEKNFNFNPNTLEYNLEVANEIDKLTIEAIPTDSKAKVEYKDVVDLKEGKNEITIEVTAEDGTIKTYKLNVVRKTEESLVNNIVIEGVDFIFESNTYEYEIETILDKLNFIVTLNSKSATYDILNNDNLSDSSIVRIVVTDNDKEETYEFKVKRPKEVVADELPDNNNNANNNNLDNAATSVGNSFLSKYEMYIGLITFGVGLLSLLLVILLKPKDSQIM